MKDGNKQDEDAGLKAYFEMYAWFMRTTGLRQPERMAALMTPKQAKSEEDLADAIEAWEREERELCYGSEKLTLTDPWTITALKAILPQRTKDHVEMDSSKLGTYQDLREEVMHCATH